MAWPSIAKPSSVSASYYKKQHKSTFEDGSQLSRAAHTVGRRKWTLIWTAMLNTDLALLLAAFESDQGDTFSWTHPQTGSSYTVGYGNDEIQYDLDAKFKTRYRVVVELEER